MLEPNAPPEEATPPELRPASPTRLSPVPLRPVGAQPAVPTPLGLRPVAGALARPASAIGPATRPVTRPAGQRAVVYRGLPGPVRWTALAGVAIVIGLVVGVTAPTALMRLGATAALRPGMLDWYMVRALGFLAYFALAGSVLYGLLLSTKILDAIAHRPVSFALHKDLSIVGLVLMGLHGLLLIGDASYPFTLRSIVVPFASPYAPLEVGIGQLAFYTTLVVTLSFYVRRQIGQSVWRLIHYLTFLAFIGGTSHGILSGSDSGSSWAFWAYLVPLAIMVFLIAYRIVLSMSNRRHPAAAGPRLSPFPGPLDRPGAAD